MYKSMTADPWIQKMGFRRWGFRRCGSEHEVQNTGFTTWGSELVGFRTSLPAAPEPPARQERGGTEAGAWSIARARV